MGLLGTSLFLQGCSGTRYLNAEIKDDFLIVPKNAFQIPEPIPPAYRDYVVAENTLLSYPICIYRHSEDSYTALLMRCTHQGTELRVFGDRLECPAHGSEFSKSGDVKNGPADEDLRTFPVEIDSNFLKIDLT